MAKIEIELLRVSNDSKYIEFKVNCPDNYKFTGLFIRKYSLDNTGWMDGSAIISDPPSNIKVIRIETSIFGGTGMFQLRFEADLIEGSGDNTKITADGYASDINNVYTYILSLILDLDCNCSTPSKDLFKMFAFMYGHQEAMRLGRIEEAFRLYNIIIKNLKLCGWLERADNVGCEPLNCNCNV